jgi:Predicted membrane protein
VEMKKIDRKKLIVLSALLAALVCITTMLVQIPSPMNGYINLGDCFVLLSGWILGPLYGFCAGGLGSMMADIISGYAHYAPGTLIIKGVTALLAAVLYKVFETIFSQTDGRKNILIFTFSGIVAEIFMVLGYFLYAGFIFGKGLAAAMSIPGNLIQGAAGVVSAVILMKSLIHIKNIEPMIFVAKQKK